jgi:hypothetical protein
MLKSAMPIFKATLNVTMYILSYLVTYSQEMLQVKM